MIRFVVFHELMVVPFYSEVQGIDLQKSNNVRLIRGKTTDLIILGFGLKWEICFYGCFASLRNVIHG